jgi:hypothetical protein
MKHLLGDKIVQEKAAAAGVVYTALATAVSWLDIIEGVGRILLTWVGVLTGVATLIFYIYKIVELHDTRKKSRGRHAKFKRRIQDEASNV